MLLVTFGRIKSSRNRGLLKPPQLRMLSAPCCLTAAFEAKHPEQAVSLTHRNLLGKSNPSAASLAAELTQTHL